MRKKLSAVLENVLASLSEVVPLRDTKGLKTPSNVECTQKGLIDGHKFHAFSEAIRDLKNRRRRQQR